MHAARTTLLTGGRVYAPDVPGATAMAITGGVVRWLGSDDAARAQYPHAERVALHGALVTPAFVDAHVHSTASGLHLRGLDLSTANDAGELLAAVRDWASGAEPGQVLLAHGWDETRWRRARLPTRTELDGACLGAPVYLSRVDAHSALVSSAALALAPAARTAPGFSVDGPLTRQAHHYVRGAAQAAITPMQRRAAQLAFLTRAAAAGIASVHECAGPEISGAGDLAALLALAGPDMPEVVAYWGERAPSADSPAVSRARELGARGLAGDLFVDGALGSRTAALHEPYTDEPACAGTRYLDAGEVGEHVVACTEAGLQAGFHAIGDAAVATVVAGFAAAERRVGARALGAAGHRVEHLEMIDREQARALARWGVYASVQPAFDAFWGGRAGMYARRLGAERAGAMNPLRMLADCGVPLACGSDTPITPLDPWASVRAAASHQTPGAGLAVQEALGAHTAGGRRAAGDRDPRSGTLTPGAPADFAIWEAGPARGPDGGARLPAEAELLAYVQGGAAAPRCLGTVRGGVWIHDAR